MNDPGDQDDQQDGRTAPRQATATHTHRTSHTEIQLVDLNGDSKADYIVVNPDGSAQAWVNGGAGCGGWCWSPWDTIASGVGVPGSWVHFGDIDGDQTW